jgi:peptidyl-prolyl cis-trans isomerase A (cyclophilin A)
MTARHMTRACWALTAFACLAAAADDDKHPRVVLDTSMGPVTLELDRTRAPISVDNFLKYVDSGYYNGLIFHRVIDGFMVQGGGFTDSMREKHEGQLDPIKNEGRNGLSNQRGTVAMARTNDPNSATSQFYINLVDNSRGLDDNPAYGPYAVFGKVVDGMDVVDKIAKVPTRVVGGMRDVPEKPVYIRSAKRVR